FPLFPSISDIGTITIWAEIGVIFLLFSLGLEFSFKKLVKVGGSASITAVVEVAFMLLIGYIAGQLMGWSSMDSIFLGGILSISSTTIIIRAFDELGIKSQKFAGLVFGILVVEDLVAILLLVLLSTLAASQQFAGAEMFNSVLKLIFFLVLWFIAGIFILPTFLKRARNLMNDETLLVVSLGLCLLMVVLATSVGFSPALGAFIMGSILAETIYAEKIEHLTKPIKDLFGAIFFVSVGMLIDPTMLIKYAGPVVIITFATIFGKVFSTTIGALISGQPLKSSLQSGFALAQIGEFSFIIATLGLTLKVTSDFLYPIAVAVSAITTFTTPYLIGMAEPIYNRIESRLPERWKTFLNNYTAGAQTISSQSDWRIVLRAYAIIVVTNSVIIIGIIIASSRFVLPLIRENIAEGTTGATITAAMAFTAMAPFLWALAAKRTQKHAYANLMMNKRSNRSQLVLLEISRVALAVFFIGFLLNSLFSIQMALIVGFILTMILIIVAPKGLRLFYTKLEHRFLINFNEREMQNAPATTPELLPWDSHLAYFKVSADSPYIGQSMKELNLRKKYGVSIAVIERGHNIIHIPGPDEKLYPADKIAAFGTDEQLQQFRQIIEAPVHDHQATHHAHEVMLQHFLLDENFPFIGTSIRDSGIREKTKSMVVGIERNGQRILNPGSGTIFEKGDILWIVGRKGVINNLLAEKAV
ncbi:MAG TPA: cation:proton antiporter, partial [Patescibacteria group bacterium]|nr:cation:proton antiporter [Patescibacteria group bacterium]